MGEREQQVERVYCVYGEERYIAGKWTKNHRLCSARVVKRTAKQVRINRAEGGSAFGYRVLFSPDDPLLAPTPEEAWERYVAAANARVKSAADRLEAERAAFWEASEAHDAWLASNLEAPDA